SREYHKPRQRSEQRQSDPPESSPRARAIDTRRINVSPRDALESGKEHQRLPAQLRVEREEHQCGQSRRRTAEPPGPPEPEREHHEVQSRGSDKAPRDRGLTSLARRRALRPPQQQNP